MSRAQTLAATVAFAFLSIGSAAGLTGAAGAAAPITPPPASGRAGPLPEQPPLEVYLGGGRFRLLADFETASDAGNAVPRQLTADTAAFWFFRPDNLELMVKLLDACTVNQRFWVFAGGLTDVGVELTVEDTVAGVSRPYSKRRGTPFAPIQDTGAFATCSEQRECGRGTAEEIAASPRADISTEWLALAAGRRLTAGDLYPRMAADLAAIAAIAPETAESFFWGRWDPNSVLIEFERATYDAIVEGDYDAWDCLNGWYGVVDVVPREATETSGIVEVQYHPLLHPYLIGPDYASLPGALGFFPEELEFPTLPTIPLPQTTTCARVDADAVLYYFQRGSVLWHAVSPAPGQVPTNVESFDLTLPTIPPLWVGDALECRQTYVAPIVPL